MAGHPTTLTFYLYLCLSVSVSLPVSVSLSLCLSVSCAYLAVLEQCGPSLHRLVFVLLGAQSPGPRRRLDLKAALLEGGLGVGTPGDCREEEVTTV